MCEEKWIFLYVAYRRLFQLLISLQMGDKQRISLYITYKLELACLGIALPYPGIIWHCSVLIGLAYYLPFSFVHFMVWYGTMMFCCQIAGMPAGSTGAGVEPTSTVTEAAGSSFRWK